MAIASLMNIYIVKNKKIKETKYKRKNKICWLYKTSHRLKSFVGEIKAYSGCKHKYIYLKFFDI